MRADTIYSTPLRPIRFAKHWEKTATEELKTRRNRQILIEFIKAPEKVNQDTFKTRFNHQEKIA